MSAGSQPEARGWCPGVLSPMVSGDGLIVRVKPSGATLTLDQLDAIAAAADCCGNGHIDLTRRANLQIRGVRNETLQLLQNMLAPAGLVDSSAEIEKIRNIVIGPLAGLDPAEVLDMRPLAVALECALAADPALWRLPGKFSFVLDGGGIASLDDVFANVRLKAFRDGGSPAIAIGVCKADRTAWLGQCAASSAVAAGRAIARGLSSQPYSLDAIGLHALGNAAASQLVGTETGVANSSAPTAPGLLAHDGQVFAAIIGIPFGRIEAKTLVILTNSLAAAGISEVRLSPWRSLCVPMVDPANTRRILDHAAAHGLIVEANDSLLGIDACVGAPACAAATGETRAAARSLAALRPNLPGIVSIHVSGCAKGCARSIRADLTLVAQRDGFTISFDSRADTNPSDLIEAGALAGLPSIVERHSRAGVHG